MADDREIELKLETDPAGARALGGDPLLDGQKPAKGKQQSIYYDTPEGTLRAAGFSLRVRSKGKTFVQTIKQSNGATAGMFNRPEWEHAVAGLEPDFEAAGETPLAPILAKKIKRHLAPVVTTDINRSTWLLAQGDDEVELTLDQGSVSGGSTKERLVEIELELKRGRPAFLLELARQLGDRIPLRLGVLSKAERGYELAGRGAGKAVKAEPIELGATMTTAEGFAAIAHACLRHFRRNEPLIPKKRDPSALHQARVALRRLRSAFSLFRPIIADAEYERLRGELRWVTEQLGQARNLDVFLKRLDQADKSDLAKALRKRLNHARGDAYSGVEAMLDSPRLRRLMLDIVAWIQTGAWRGKLKAQAPLLLFATRRIDRRWEKVEHGGRNLSRLAAEPRHELRIEIKKLRYAIEFMAQIMDGEVDRKAFLAGLEDMQEHLGELNDRETARHLLESLLAGDPNADALIRYAEQLLGESRTEKEQVEAGQTAFARLEEIGPFWRQ